MTSEFCDLSVGMFEGRPGWNTLVVRSKAGADLVTSAFDEGYLETKDMPPESIAQLTRAAGEKKARALRTLVRRKLINNENGERSALRMPPDVVEKILTY
jgi:coenzyme F420 hydrogenase subunit beta